MSNQLVNDQLTVVDPYPRAVGVYPSSLMP